MTHTHTTHSPTKLKSVVLALLISILSIPVFAQVNLPDGIHVLNPKPADDRTHYATRVAAWNSTTGVALSRRYPGLTVFIDSANAEYWWKYGDLTNAGLVLKTAGGGSSLYTGASPTDITVGHLTSGTDISGMTISEILQAILVDSGGSITIDRTTTTVDNSTITVDHN